jgi:hypothetical protein
VSWQGGAIWTTSERFHKADRIVCEINRRSSRVNVHIGIVRRKLARMESNEKIQEKEKANENFEFWTAVSVLEFQFSQLFQGTG